MRLCADGMVQVMNLDGDLLADYCGQLLDVGFRVLCDAPLGARFWIEYCHRGPRRETVNEFHPCERRTFWNRMHARWAQKVAREFREQQELRNGTY